MSGNDNVRYTSYKQGNRVLMGLEVDVSEEAEAAFLHIIKQAES